MAAGELLSIGQSNGNVSTYKANGDIRHTQTTATVVTNVEEYQLDKSMMAIPQVIILKES